MQDAVSGNTKPDQLCWVDICSVSMCLLGILHMVFGCWEEGAVFIVLWTVYTAYVVVDTHCYVPQTCVHIHATLPFTHQAHIVCKYQSLMS